MTNSDMEVNLGEEIEPFPPSKFYLKQVALSEAVKFHAGTPRNVTGHDVVEMAKTFESYLNGSNT